MSVSSFIGYLKGESTLIIFEYHANLKYKCGNRHFFPQGMQSRCNGYHVSTVGLNKEKTAKYIQQQANDMNDRVGFVLIMGV